MSEKSKRRSSKRAAQSKQSGGAKARVSGARNAFASADMDASRAAHDRWRKEASENASEATEHHQSGGEYLKSAVYGGMDGIITTFAVVAAAVGGSLEYRVAVILGCSNLLADGISMGFGDYVSSTAEYEFAVAERKREMWECENYIEGERAEMIDIYASKKGITRKGAKKIVDIISKDYDTFVDIMMVEELHMMPPDPDDSPAKNGLVTFGAFVALGLVPLLPYIVHVIAVPSDWSGRANIDITFGVAIFLSAFTMFMLGVLTKNFSTRPWWKRGGFTLFNGGLAALASFFIAYLIANAAGIEAV